jgi:hypothetical protein
MLVTKEELPCADGNEDRCSTTSVSPNDFPSSLILPDVEYLSASGKRLWLLILYLNVSLLSYGFSYVQENYERLK